MLLFSYCIISYHNFISFYTTLYYIILYIVLYCNIFYYIIFYHMIHYNTLYYICSITKNELDTAWIVVALSPLRSWTLRSTSRVIRCCSRAAFDSASNQT